MTSSIKRQIDSLSREEVDHVIEYARYARSKAPRSEQRIARTTQAVGADPYDWVLDIIRDICKGRGVGTDNRALDIAAAKNLTAYDVFKKEVPEVVAYIETFARDRAIQRAILKMGYAYLVEDRMVQHVSGLMSMTAQIPTALNQMFPGYYTAGLMPLVVKRLAAKQ